MKQAKRNGNGRKRKRDYKKAVGDFGTRWMQSIIRKTTG